MKVYGNELRSSCTIGAFSKLTGLLWIPHVPPKWLMPTYINIRFHKWDLISVFFSKNLEYTLTETGYLVILAFKSADCLITPIYSRIFHLFVDVRTFGNILSHTSPQGVLIISISFLPPRSCIFILALMRTKESRESELSLRTWHERSSNNCSFDLDQLKLPLGTNWDL